MRHLLLLLAATALTATPAAAQHQGHHMPAPPTKKPPAKKPAAKKTPAKKAAARKAPAKKVAVKKPATKKVTAKTPSAKMPGAKEAAKTPPAADPHAGHLMPSEAVSDPHAGHVMPAEPESDPHAGHDMSGAAVEVAVGPPPAEALRGPEHAADTVWGRPAMEPGRAVLVGEHGNMSAYKILIDQAEVRVRDGRNGYFVNAEGWYGGDIDKLWIKTEVEGDFGGKLEQAELQALWSHAIGPWFDLQAGLRLDAEPDTRGHLVVGVQGLAPYWIEVDSAVFLSDKGDITARAEAEHDVRITRKLILQPRAELDFALQDIPRRHVGSGLSTAELGLRLRYEFVPNLAPYVGVNYERSFGDTRSFRRIEGEDTGGLSLVAGVRTWF